MGVEPGGPRRAEVLAALSLAIDLGLGQPMEHMLRSALIATRLAERLGLGEAVGAALAGTFERWDGSGLPAGARGDRLPIEVRVVHLAEVAEVHLRRGGARAAVAMAEARSGSQFDPGVVTAFA